MVISEPEMTGYFSLSVSSFPVPFEFLIMIIIPYYVFCNQEEATVNIKNKTEKQSHQILLLPYDYCYSQSLVNSSPSSHVSPACGLKVSK